MKLYTVLFSLLILGACTSLPKTNCEVVRAAIDIGSGSTKLKVAKVDQCLQKIDKMLFSDSFKVSYKEDLQESEEKIFSTKIFIEGLTAVQDLKTKAMSFRPTGFSAVATSAFRTARNSSQLINKISENLNGPAQIISQTEEARLGFYAGVGRVNKSINKVIVWDIGGGSMQISALNKDKQFVVYQGQLASVGFARYISRVLQGKKEGRSPNPISREHFKKALSYINRKIIAEIPQELKNKMKDSSFEIVGIGGVHFHSVFKQTKKRNNSYSRKEVRSLIEEKLYQTDQQIGGDYASTDVTNLILVYGIMQNLGLNKIQTFDVNLADGVLVSPQYW